MKRLNPVEPEKIVDLYEILDKHPEFATELGYGLEKLKKLVMIIPEENFDELRGALELYVKMKNE